MFQYQTFDIVETAQMCGLRLNTRTLGRNEVEAWCPFCTTPSSAYHMYLNRRKGFFYCHKCSSQGNSVTLYAKIFGVDNREASKRLMERQGSAPPQWIMPKKPTPPVAPPAHRHDVYYDMLQCMQLFPVHRRNLMNRGLSAQRIALNGYRSVPDSPKRLIIAEYLSRRYELSGVPGFYWLDGQWRLCGRPGILIPICDKDSYIQGLQIRLDSAAGKRYRWLSSNPDNGFLGGTSSSVWIHITGRSENGEACLTEGALKGDVASYLSEDRLFICLAGVTSVRYLDEVLRSLGVSKVYGCYDMDQVAVYQKLQLLRRAGTDPNAHKPCPLERMEAHVKDAGVSYERRIWDPAYNGIDEFFLAQRREQEALAG